MIFRKNTTRSGSALLVAILVMGILMTLTLGLSNLVIREITQTGDLVAAGEAYFASEAGVENALLDLHEHLPGYETAGLVNAVDGEWIEYKDPVNADFHYRYRIRNKGDAYPYFDDDKPLFFDPVAPTTKAFIYDEDRAKTYNVLPLNQTVTIPLFTEDAQGNIQDVEDFLIQYYVRFNEDSLSADFQNINLESFDVLRWKLFGNPITGEKLNGVIASSNVNTLKTDAISDFYPAKNVGVIGGGADEPVCIGSSMDFPTEYIVDKCWFPATPYSVEDTEGQTTGTVESPAEGLWSAARECYESDAGTIVSGGKIKTAASGGCSIPTFVKNHSRDYITLTNVVNPDIIGLSTPEERAAKANIYYRIIAKKGGPADPQLPREFAEISSDGYTHEDKVKQSIDVRLRLNSFLPVFNFSLYRTDTDPTSSKETPIETQQLGPL